MNYYIEKTIKTYAELSEIISKAHNSGIQFAFYFDNVNNLRLFSDSIELLKQFNCEIKETPICVKYVKCTRVRAAEKTATQQAKRLVRFKKHLADKGIACDDSRTRKAVKSNYDYFIDVFSQSSKNSFRIYVKNAIKHEAKQGLFSSYGLSLNDSTVPLF